jgi:hypothetical protein
VCTCTVVCGGKHFTNRPTQNGTRAYSLHKEAHRVAQCVCACARTRTHVSVVCMHGCLCVHFFTSSCVVHYVLSAPFMLDPYRQHELGVEHKRPKDEPSRRLRPAKLERQRVLLAIPAAVPATGREHIGGSNGVPTRSCTPRHSERRSLSSTDTFGRWLGDYQMNLFSRVRRSANRRYGSRSQNICRESVSSCANGQFKRTAAMSEARKRTENFYVVAQRRRVKGP